ncbi:jg21533 [Pararge aegeria aegeria]|uniref:Jg21533 protein n=1 Tax=Pararge aegeria aegeria TaxID=348720 RepID=A0A8S4RSN9_9NEOP|nr:jg21533 [Pararge aegeria aegeria]
MKLKVAKMFLFFVVCAVMIGVSGVSSKQRLFFESIKEDKSMDVADFSVYYDLETNKTIRTMMPRPWYRPGWLLRLPFQGGPCKCDSMRCKCCTGIRVQALNLDRQTCGILTYDPQQSMIDFEVVMNNASVLRESFSSRNPPPFCVPVPVPYLPPGLVDMCVRLFDVNLVDQRLHVCMDMDTRIDKAPIVILHFDCMDMGAGGVSLTKPGDGSDSNIVPPGTTTEPSQADSDVYDPVIEQETITDKSLFKNSIKYI